MKARVREEAISIKLDKMDRRLAKIERISLLQGKELLTPEEAAMVMGVSRDHIYRLTSGKNPAIGFSKPDGKCKYIEKAELLAYMRRNRIKGGEERSTNTDTYLLEQDRKRRVS